MSPRYNSHTTHRYTVINYQNGDRYEGQVLMAVVIPGNNSTIDIPVRDGHGTYLCANKEVRSNYEFVGNWKNNRRDGSGGRCFYYNGDLYIGDWKAGRRNGSGDYFQRKGERYMGEWKEDMRHGPGTMTSSNGTKYVGKYYQDKKHGQGQIFMPHGHDPNVRQVIFEEVWDKGALLSHKEVKH